MASRNDDETRVNPRPAFPEARTQAYHLRVVRSPDADLIGKNIPLRGLEVRIGRDVQNTISIADPDASRVHAALVFGLQGYRVRDLQSTNGTVVNGSRVQSDFLLHPGDLILVGATVLAFERS